MNIYKLTTKADTQPYDYFDSVIVAANSEDEAKMIHPLGTQRSKLVDGVFHYVSASGYSYECKMWALMPSMVDVELVGVADEKYIEPTVICSSYNAG